MIRLIRTVLYLKPIQIYYRLFYYFRNSLFKKSFPSKKNIINPSFIYTNSIKTKKIYFGNNEFVLLNINKKFKEIDWEYKNNGRLWTYNLCYFDYLNQKDINLESGKRLILDFISKHKNLNVALESYPISLRNINWIKFLSQNKISHKKIDRYLYNSYLFLLNNLEYHLLGNHLLENAFSLLFGSFYFNSEEMYYKSLKILVEELDEQILDDGAHFELSPMYHSVILYRLLESIDLITQNKKNKYNNNLINILNSKAEIMLSWLSTIIYSNGDLPHFNDSTDGVAFKPSEIFNYATKLNINWTKIKLSNSGFRKFSNSKIELFMDVGNIGPRYQPGHAHCDTLSFEFYYNKLPIIVDRGISSYDDLYIRNKERGTLAHNTIQINCTEQSDIWGSFRVGKRAEIINFNENKDSILAAHNGYSNINTIHSRNFKFNDKKIEIKDVINSNSNYEIISSLHFHPDRKIFLENNFIIIDNIIKIELINYFNVKIKNYNYALGFNNRVSAKKIIANVNNNSNLRIYYEY